MVAHDPQARVLWEKLRTLSFDHGTGPRTFATRLASEQGWSAGFTSRVIEEYRRFLLLFALVQRREQAIRVPAGNPPVVRIVPSAAVDKAWHLHLLYTQSYWGTLCQDILGAPLHHQPADGSSGEEVALDEIYRVNMEAYRTTFGELAPSDIWPTPKGMPPPGMPLAEVLERAGPALDSGRWGRYLVLAGVLAPLLILGLLVGKEFPSLDGVTGALEMAVVIVVTVCACICLLVGLVLGSERSGRRRSVDGQGENIFFCGGSDGSGGSSGYDGHSHGSHGGHGDSGGSHSCGGHGCGGHGCGGH